MIVSDTAVAIVPDAAVRPSLRPRLGAVSFLHRFGSALNRHVHLHACVTDGLFMPAQEGVEFLPARPITPADLLALTDRVRTRLVRWFFRHGLLDAEAAADMLAWQNSGFSVDASVRIALVDRDVPSYLRSLEHLLRYCARPRSGRFSHTSANRSSRHHSRRPEARRPPGPNSCRPMTTATRSRRRLTTCR